MTLVWTTGGYFSGMKAKSPATGDHPDGSSRCYRIKIAKNQQRDVLAFLPRFRDGMKVFDTIDEAKAWCQDHENALLESQPKETK